jgi:hypothetical protein
MRFDAAKRLTIPQGSDHFCRKMVSGATRKTHSGYSDIPQISAAPLSPAGVVLYAVARFRSLAPKAA